MANPKLVRGIIMEKIINSFTKCYLIGPMEKTKAKDAGRGWRDNLRPELEKLINSTNREAESNTPDFILAEYLEGCLQAFDIAVGERDKWYGNSRPSINKTQ